MIRNHTYIKGIGIENEMYKIMQYADDTVILLDGSEKALRCCLNSIQQCSLAFCQILKRRSVCELEVKKIVIKNYVQNTI